MRRLSACSAVSRRRLLAGLALLPAVGLLASLPKALRASTAGRPPDGVYPYRIEHSEHGALGTHVITIESDGDERRVTVERRLKVSRLLITVFREETETEEIWRQGRMVSYRRHTDDGDLSELEATEQGGQLVAVGTEGRHELPLGTFPTHPWNPAIVQESLLMDTNSGAPVKVASRPAGEEELVIGGRRLKAQRWEMVGDQDRTLWYDDDGRLLRMEIHRDDGATIAFMLQAIPG